MTSNPHFSSKKAWRCAALLMLGSLGIEFVSVVAHGHSPAAAWLGSHETGVSIASGYFMAGYWLVAIYITASCPPILLLVEKMGLKERPNWHSSWIIPVALTLASVSQLAYYNRFIHGEEVSGHIHHKGGWPWLLYSFYLIILLPACEELTLRGFIFPVFRTRYSLTCSVMFVYLIELLLYRNILYGSWSAFLCYSFLFVCLCLAREKGNVYTCIVAHCLYSVIGIIA